MAALETYALISVTNGKFHKPRDVSASGMAWRSITTACGVTVTPQNYFKTEADADSYTGGRLSQFICQHCAPRA